MTRLMERPATTTRFLRAASALMEEAHDHQSDIAWLVTRADGDDLVVLCAAGEQPALREGERVRVRSEADVMLPLELPDGSFFGALCALGAGGEHHDAHSVQAQRIADVLASVLAAEWEAQSAAEQADQLARRAARAVDEALIDPLTGVANRRGWDRAVEAEERRRRRYGGHASVVLVDVDDLAGLNRSQGHLGGDLCLRMVAAIMDEASRDSDTVARIGDDEFGLLALDCDDAQVRVVVSRLRRALASQGIGASVGGASRRAGVGLPAAWEEAEGVLQTDKARRAG